MDNANQKKRVLVVDDDTAVRLLVRATLEQNGFEVAEASDGLECLKVFQRLHPDIILLDVMMPNMDGFTVCAEIRKLSGYERIPILMLTGLDDTTSINRAYEAGATDFITKPINWPILGHRVRYMLRSSQIFEDLATSQASLASAQRIAHLGNWGWNKENDFFYQSDECYRIFDQEPGKIRMTRQTFLKSVHPEDRKRVKQAIISAYKKKQSCNIDFRILLPDNSERTAHLQVEIVLNSTGEVSGMQGTIQDVTERAMAEQKIRYLAYYDSLTDLPNRQFFKEQLDRALAQAKRSSRMVATLFLDLDRFKRINDTLGHDKGDLLLQEVAQRLTYCLRDTDLLVSRNDHVPLNGSLARLGGDEFIVLLPELVHAQDAAKVAQRVIDMITMPILLKGHEVFVTASIGIAIYPNDGADAESLLKNADTAMYHAKDLGRNSFQFYTHAMNAKAYEKLSLESSLRKALERGEFLLHYQPKINLATGQIIGTEALIRWQHPELGMVSPGEFIPLAEEAGLIVPIGEWVLNAACAQNRIWQNSGFPNFGISINMSSPSFRQKNLNQVVAKALKESGLDASSLELEVTESILMQSSEMTLNTLHKLKEMGVKISIDDFGTGYSSLSYLKRFPLDSLKIDQSFVRDIVADPDDAAIIIAIIAMAKSLKLSVIAEGVETESQAAFLRNHGCHDMQGYLFSRPLPAEKLTQLLSNAASVIPVNLALKKTKQADKLSSGTVIVG